jgi:hypothetical protein
MKERIKNIKSNNMVVSEGMVDAVFKKNEEKKQKNFNFQFQFQSLSNNKKKSNR